MRTSIVALAAFASIAHTSLAIPTTIRDSEGSYEADPALAGDWKIVIPQTAPPPSLDPTARSVRRWGGLLLDSLVGSQAHSKRDDPLLIERSTTFDVDTAAGVAKVAPVNLRRWGGLDLARQAQADLDLTKRSVGELPAPPANLRRWGGLEKRQEDNSDGLRNKAAAPSTFARWKPSPVTTNRRTKTPAAAPATTSQPQPAPTTSSVDVPPAQTTGSTPVLVGSSPSTTSSAPVATSAPSRFGYTSNGYNLDGSHDGPATWYYTGLGACGWWNTDSDDIVAISELIFLTFPGATANPNLNPVCGNKIKATYGSKEVIVTVVDYCVGCTNPWHLDMSPGAFQKIATLDDGLVNVKWSWV